MTRRDPNMTEKLAATLIALCRALGQPIPREHLQSMTADQICSLFQFDHYPVRYVDGGTTHPDNLEPMWISGHRLKTRTVDVPQIRKADRLATARQALQTAEKKAAHLAPGGGAFNAVSKITDTLAYSEGLIDAADREDGTALAFPKPVRTKKRGPKIPSRPFQQRRK